MDNQTQITPPPAPPPPMIEQATPKPPTNFLLVGLIALIAAAVASAATYFTLNSQKTAQLPAQPTPIVQAQPTPTPDETANWKMYTNNSYGFSFKYPSTFRITPDHVFNNGLLVQLFFKDKDVMPGMTIGLYTKDYDRFTSLVNDLNIILSTKKLGGYVYSQIQTKNIDGQTLYSFDQGFDDAPVEGFKTVFPVGGPLNQLRASGVIKNIFYDIYYPYEPNTFKDDQKIFDQILSTFKFTP